MSEMWKQTSVDLDVTGWIGETLHLTNVPALKNTETGKVRVFPSEVAKAEGRAMAKQFGLEDPRNMLTLLMLYAKPGIFKEGEVFYKYHINKMLFYQWKELQKQGFGDAIVFDEFEKADRGPVPKNITTDLQQLAKSGLIETKIHQWGKREKDGRRSITLTENGRKIAETLWYAMPEQIRDTTMKVKEQIYPATPEQVKNRVHKEYPEYKNTYVEEDRD